jgi:hypothetical protein
MPISGFSRLLGQTGDYGPLLYTFYTKTLMGKEEVLEYCG